jgi:hypothetical protein
MREAIRRFSYNEYFTDVPMPLARRIILVKSTVRHALTVKAVLISAIISFR